MAHRFPSFFSFWRASEQFKAALKSTARSADLIAAQ
jgi:hypothetical protein